MIKIEVDICPGGGIGRHAPIRIGVVSNDRAGSSLIRLKIKGCLNND